MNKQELIEKIKKLPFVLLSERYISQNYVLELLEQLDEPEKVKVPQFVADWIEESKKHCKNVVEFFKYKYPNTEMIKWIESEKRFDLIARAWLDGYEVEKEKRYLVKLKAVDQYLVSAKDEKFLGFLQSKLRSKFTRKELEDLGFGWVFDCEGVEVEEVTE